MDVSQIIATNIKSLRKSKGLSQLDVAEAIGINASVYSRIESGDVMASHDKLHNLSKLFRVPIEKFFEGLGSNIQNNYDNAQVNSNVQINLSNQLDILQSLNEIKQLLNDFVKSNKI